MSTWDEAFLAQAGSDFDAYEFLAASTLPRSHRLHYLQMWLEKLCKAYTPDDEFRKRHNVIAKVLPRLISEHWRRIGFDKRPDMTQIRELCREIDLLHPQVDDDGRRLITSSIRGQRVLVQRKSRLSGRSRLPNGCTHFQGDCCLRLLEVSHAIPLYSSDETAR